MSKLQSADGAETARESTWQAIDPSDLLDVARQAGEAVMDVYSKEFDVQIKADDSPLTEADLRSNEIITRGLRGIDASVPILSEESKKQPYCQRKSWNCLWLVDPLDGTKEFVNRTDEFTINIAFVVEGKPVIGVVYAPALKRLFYAKRGEGAYREDENGTRLLQPTRAGAGKEGAITIVGSRSHHSEAMTQYLTAMEAKYSTVEFVKAGSALKFCLVAEGSADVYPRLAPTWEWDSAAAHAVAVESGCSVLRYEDGEELEYNKENLLNPWFICK